MCKSYNQIISENESESIAICQRILQWIYTKNENDGWRNGICANTRWIIYTKNENEDICVKTSINLYENRKGYFSDTVNLCEKRKRRQTKRFFANTTINFYEKQNWWTTKGNVVKILQHYTKSEYEGKQTLFLQILRLIKTKTKATKTLFIRNAQKHNKI